MNGIETPSTHSQWDQSLGEELANSISHGLGLLAALIGAPILMLAAWRNGDRLFFIGAMVFTAAMIASLRLKIEPDESIMRASDTGESGEARI
jgi:predicted membrane channel-forming protein YqfA (hemolysin III family)